MGFLMNLKNNKEIDKLFIDEEKYNILQAIN